MTQDPAAGDRDAVSAVLAGDKEKFALLVRAHQVKVRSLCLSVLRDPSEADDAAQEVFVKAYCRLSDYRAESSFATWLYRIGYNHCLDVLKARSRRRSESLDAMTEQGFDRAEPQGPDSGDADALRRALDELPPEYRAVLTLREAEGLSYEEIAKTTGVSLDSVKARLRRAREALQEKARHFFEGGGV